MIKSPIDFNGDGKIDDFDGLLYSMYLTDQLDQMRYEEKLGKIIRAIKSSSYMYIDNERFEELCDSVGLRMEDFDQSDIDEIARRTGAGRTPMTKEEVDELEGRSKPAEPDDYYSYW